MNRATFNIRGVCVSGGVGPLLRVKDGSGNEYLIREHYRIGDQAAEDTMRAVIAERSEAVKN